MIAAGREYSALPTPITIDIAGRGSAAVWDCSPTGDGAPAQAPLLLLHGWNVDAPLNFASAVPLLRQHRRVVMFDQHGHGRGIRSGRPFDLARCAGDAVAVLDALEIERAILVGYSLGGAIAQVMASEHPDRCEALVLAATADSFAVKRREVAQFSFLTTSAHAMRRLPARSRDITFRRISEIACRRYPEWVLETVLAADPVTLLQAGGQLGRFDALMWKGNITAPSAVVVTSADTVVSPARQHRLARIVEATEVIEVHADHDLPIRNDPRFADALERAVEAVAGVTISGSLG